MTLVLAFGSYNDPQAWKMADILKQEFPEMDIRKSNNPEDILSADGDVVILDVVKNISKTRLLSINDLKDRRLSSVHDFDLGFFLKLMKNTGIIGNLRIIGIPVDWTEKSLEEAKTILES